MAEHVLFDDDDLDTDIVRMRRDDSLQIESQLREIAEIHKDLNKVVHVQSKPLDSLEDHIEMAVSFSSKGNDELCDADEYKSLVRSRYIAVGMTLGGLLAAAGSIFYLSAKR
jgi:t-SNARE complex subunit (syntaxin)